MIHKILLMFFPVFSARAPSAASLHGALLSRAAWPGVRLRQAVEPGGIRLLYGLRRSSTMAVAPGDCLWHDTALAYTAPQGPVAPAKSAGACARPLLRAA